MSALELLQLNLLSPVILCFFLGAVATWIRSDLRFPEEIYQALTVYLLLAIGLKGGVSIVESAGTALWWPMLGALLLSAATPLWCIPLLRYGGRMSLVDAHAIAAHYGSVSVVTFLAGIAFLQALGVEYEGFLPALLALMEIPAIVVALLLANKFLGGDVPWLVSLGNVARSKSIFLLFGALLIGLIVGERGFSKVEPFFVEPFQGVLCLFLLEMGMVASRRLQDLRRVGLFLVGFGVLIPMVHAVLGIVVGDLCGLSRGGCFILGLLAASASYIAAPATIRLALPSASPALYLTSSLAITFPFNLVIGIPLYYSLSGWIVS